MPSRSPLRKDPIEPRNLKLEQFRCRYCDKKQHHTELDFRQRVACCRTCAPEHLEERLLGPWLDKRGSPRVPATLAA